METPQPIKCQPKGEVEPASGWKTDDIVVNKSHLCLLLNPQFTLRSTADAESILVITAAKASLQTFAILDRNYVDGLTSDPINAYIMKRYVFLSWFTFLALISELKKLRVAEWPTGVLPFTGPRSNIKHHIQRSST